MKTPPKKHPELHAFSLLGALILLLFGAGAAAGVSPGCVTPDSAPVVVIDGCDTGIVNQVLDNGCSLNDEIAFCASQAENHGGFVGCVADLADDLKKAGLITGREQGSMVSCAARADLPRDEDGVTITILSPVDGSTVPERLLAVRGTIDPVPVDPGVSLRGFRGTVDTSGHFTIPAFPLSDGENSLIVRAYSGATEVAQANLRVFYYLPAEAAVEVTPEEGGTAEVVDPDSPVYGAAISIPPGAATRPFRARVESDPEHVPNLPFGEVPVGPAVGFGPVAEVFTGPVQLTLPFDPTALPAGTEGSDLFVRALADEGWQRVPISGMTADRVTVVVNSLTLTPFVVAVEYPLAPGQVLVDTTPAHATLYVDRVDTRARTPVILAGVPAGSHELKVYLPGFNEVFRTLSVPPGGGRVHIDLGVPQAPIPTVTLASYLQDGMMVTSSFLNIQASVSYNGAPLTSGLAVLSVNGRDTFETIDFDGVIRGAIALFPGDNLLQVRVTGPNGSTGVSPTINIIRVSNLAAAAAASQDITITLSWNTDGTDLDMHVFDPNGRHAWYGSLGGIPGGRLDRDDVDGFGPEVFTLPNPPRGTYRVAVDAYRIDGTPTVGSLTVRVGSREIFTGTYRFTAQDYNATGGNPIGANPAAFWDAHRFGIGDLVIVEIRTHQQSAQDEAIFTTHDDENDIQVRVDALDTIADADIHFEIREVPEDFEIDTSSLTGRNITFQAAHEPLQGLTNPRMSHRLTYRIVAYTLDQNNARDLESDPEVLTQEERSQIRQEYVDKRDFNNTFVRATPGRASIIDAGGYQQQPGEHFTFNEYSAWSDFGPGLAVIGASRTIANAMRTAWGYPLRITSGWRNPRRNDSLTGSSINSYHQTGDAVDLNPSQNSANWPASVPGCLDGQQITTYAQAQEALTCLAGTTLDSGTYDTLFHLNHLHIEAEGGN